MPAVTPHPSPEQLAAFDLGRLDPRDWAAVERHIACCESCCSQLEAIPDDPLVALVRSSVFRGADTRDQLTGCTGTDASPHRASEIPAELNDHPRYRVLGMVGAGGMGVVFKAEHRLMERTVALKVINQRLVERPAAVERFRREVKAAARLDHPNIVTAYDAEQAGDIHFLVMEFVEGASLDRLLEQQGPLPISHACYLVQQAALGLQHAYERGMVHRDIKPQNLMLTPDGRVKVLDFGLARFARESAAAEGLTVTGIVVGTPDYIAPEQALNPREADIRADIYSLGCTFYHLLSGRPPFPDGTTLQKLIGHREGTPRPLSELRPDAPAELVRVVGQMLAKEPEQRFQTPGEIAAALAPFTDAPKQPTPEAPRPKRNRAGWYVAAAALFLAVGSAIAMLAWPREPKPTRVVEELATPATTPQVVEVRPTEPAKVPVAARPTEPAKVSAPKTPRDQTVAWLEANNKFRASHPFLSQTVQKIDKQIKEGNGFLLYVGPDLVKTNRPSYLCVREGVFYRFDLTPDQGRALGMAANQTSFQSIFKDKEPRIVPAPFELSDLRFQRADGLPLNQPLKGTVAFRRLVPGARSDGVRVTYPRNGRRVMIRQGHKPLATDQGHVRFVIDPISPDAKLPTGPLVLFVELYRQDGDTLTIISPPVVALINVVAPE